MTLLISTIVLSYAGLMGRVKERIFTTALFCPGELEPQEIRDNTSEEVARALPRTREAER